MNLTFDFLNNETYIFIRFLLDFFIVTYIVYLGLKVSKNTKAVLVIRGSIIVGAIWFISSILQLTILKFLLSQILIYGIFGLIVIFQPELRMFLEKIGKYNFSSIYNKAFNFKSEIDVNTYNPKNIEAIVESTYYMSKLKIGALMSIELEDNLDEYIKTGIPLNSKISKELLINIFTPNVPLHDGALIFKNTRIECASSYLPLSSSTEISKELGTRHRAAIGLSEVTDALTIIVSEETGAVSITRHGKLYRGLDKEEFERMLTLILLDNSNVEKSNTVIDEDKRIKFFNRFNLKKTSLNKIKKEESNIIEKTDDKSV